MVLPNEDDDCRPGAPAKPSGSGRAGKGKNAFRIFFNQSGIWQPVCISVNLLNCQVKAFCKCWKPESLAGNHENYRQSLRACQFHENFLHAGKMSVWVFSIIIVAVVFRIVHIILGCVMVFWLFLILQTMFFCPGKCYSFPKWLWKQQNICY